MLVELVERVADLAAGGLDEAGDVDVADAGADHEGEIDGGVGDVVADEVEGEWLGGAFAAHGDGDVGALGALEQAGDGGGVHAGGGLAVDGEDDVAGPDAGLIGRACLRRGRGRRLGLAVLIGLRLDAHADAVVAAMLVFAHLGEGLGIVEIGVRIEGVEHARDGAVVDGLVGLVGGRAARRSSARRWSRRLVKSCRESRSVDSSEADWAATLALIREPSTAQVPRKRDDGEKSAAGAGCHVLGYLRKNDAVGGNNMREIRQTCVGRSIALAR